MFGKPVKIIIVFLLVCLFPQIGQSQPEASEFDPLTPTLQNLKGDIDALEKEKGEISTAIKLLQKKIEEMEAQTAESSFFMKPLNREREQMHQEALHRKINELEQVEGMQDRLKEQFGDIVQTAELMSKKLVEHLKEKQKDEKLSEEETAELSKQIKKMEQKQEDFQAKVQKDWKPYFPAEQPKPDWNDGRKRMQFNRPNPDEGHPGFGPGSNSEDSEIPREERWMGKSRELWKRILNMSKDIEELKESNKNLQEELNRDQKTIKKLQAKVKELEDKLEEGPQKLQNL